MKDDAAFIVLEDRLRRRHLRISILGGFLLFAVVAVMLIALPKDVSPSEAIQAKVTAQREQLAQRTKENDARREVLEGDWALMVGERNSASYSHFTLDLQVDGKAVVAKTTPDTSWNAGRGTVWREEIGTWSVNGAVVTVSGIGKPSGNLGDAGTRGFELRIIENAPGGQVTALRLEEGVSFKRELGREGVDPATQPDLYIGEASRKLTIEAQAGDLTINNQSISFPCDIDRLLQILGKPTREVEYMQSRYYFWDELGLHCERPLDTTTTGALVISLRTSQWHLMWAATRFFGGNLVVDGAAIDQHTDIEEFHRTRQKVGGVVYRGGEWIHYPRQSRIRLGSEMPGKGLLWQVVLCSPPD